MIKDTVDVEKVTEEYVRESRMRMIESGNILPMAPLFKKVRPEILKDFAFVDFTYKLVADLFPPSEDAVTGIIWKERLEELWKAFEKERNTMMDIVMVSNKFFSPEKPIPIIEFEVRIETTIKAKVSETEYDTLKKGRKADGIIHVYAQPMFDDNLRRGLIFGILTKTGG